MQSDQAIQLRVRGTGRVHRLTLPVSIGNSVNCDVFVNVASREPAFPLVYVVQESEGTIEILDWNKREVVSTKVLRDLGITLVGIRRFRTAWGTFTSALGKWAAAFLRSLRAKLCVLTAAVVLAGGGWMLLRETNQADLSQEIVALPVGKPADVGFAATAKNTAYAQGFTVSFDVNSTAKAWRLSFESLGLDRPNEIEVRLGEYVLFQFSHSDACPAGWLKCEVHIDIPSEKIKKGQNAIRFVHSVGADSPYKIHHINFRGITPASEEEVAAARRAVRLARRFFDERGVTPINLKDAQRYILEARAIMTDRSGFESEMGQMLCLKTDIERSRIAEISELWGNVSLAERLGRRADAEKFLKLLASLQDNPESDESRLIEEHLSRLRKKQ